MGEHFVPQYSIKAYVLHVAIAELSLGIGIRSWITRCYMQVDWQDWAFILSQFFQSAVHGLPY